jgi:uncharacterized protein YuzE
VGASALAASIRYLDRQERSLEGEIVIPTLTVDFGADAAYLLLSDNDVVETCEVSTGVLVDLDDMRVVVGVEVLALDTFIPRDRLITEYHLRFEDLSVLDQIRPSVTKFVQRQTLPVAAANSDNVLATA